MSGLVQLIHRDSYHTIYSDGLLLFTNSLNFVCFNGKILTVSYISDLTERGTGHFDGNLSVTKLIKIAHHFILVTTFNIQDPVDQI